MNRRKNHAKISCVFCTIIGTFFFVGKRPMPQFLTDQFCASLLKNKELLALIYILDFLLLTLPTEYTPRLFIKQISQCSGNPADHREIRTSTTSPSKQCGFRDIVKSNRCLEETMLITTNANVMQCGPVSVRTKLDVWWQVLEKRGLILWMGVTSREGLLVKPCIKMSLIPPTLQSLYVAFYNKYIL